MIEKDEVYELLDELRQAYKKQLKAYDMLKSWASNEELEAIKEAKLSMTSILNSLTKLLIDEGVCPECGFDITETREFFNSTGHHSYLHCANCNSNFDE